MLLHLGIGGHGDCPKKLFGGHKPCYDGQWQLTGHYFKRWLYTISRDFAFQSSCLVPNNVDFVLSCPKCILNLLSTSQSVTQAGKISN